jgi:hypothetical protein
MSADTARVYKHAADHFEFVSGHQSFEDARKAAIGVAGGLTCEEWDTTTVYFAPMVEGGISPDELLSVRRVLRGAKYADGWCEFNYSSPADAETLAAQLNACW